MTDDFWKELPHVRRLRRDKLEDDLYAKLTEAYRAAERICAVDRSFEEMATALCAFATSELMHSAVQRDIKPILDAEREAVCKRKGMVDWDLLSSDEHAERMPPEHLRTPEQHEIVWRELQRQLAEEHNNDQTTARSTT